MYDIMGMSPSNTQHNCDVLAAAGFLVVIRAAISRGPGGPGGPTGPLSRSGKCHRKRAAALVSGPLARLQDLRLLTSALSPAQVVMPDFFRGSGRGRPGPGR